MSDQWRKYLESRRDQYRSSIPLLEAGRIGTHEKRDGKTVDTTTETIARQKENLAEIESILAKD